MFPSRLIYLGCFAAGFCLFQPIDSASAVTYDIRATTKEDRVKTPAGGNAKLGSFGAPSINDRGTVAFASILTGNNTGAFTSNSIVARRKGNRRKADVAIQAGVTLDPDPLVPTITDPFRFAYFTQPPDPDAIPPVPSRFEQAQIPTPFLDPNFLPGYRESKTFADYSTGRFFRVGRDVAINNKNQISFNGELLFARVTVTTDKDGNVTNVSSVTENRAVFGLTYRKFGRYLNSGMVTFESYFDGILRRTMSIDKKGFLPYNASFILTPDKTVPGFASAGPVDNPSKVFNGGVSATGKVVATTESNVIGLSFFTLFSSFTDAIIADGQRLFVVADITDEGDEFDGIWQGTNPDIQPVVVKDTAAPSGGTFSSFDGVIGPSRNGNLVAFVANVTGGDASRGVYRVRRTGKDLVRVAAIGDDVPGLNGEESPGAFTEFSLAGMNNRGQVVFVASYSSADGARQGIFLSDANGENLTMMMTEGQFLAIDGKQKRVNRFDFNPVSGVNNRGQVAVTANLNDRTSSVIIAQ